MKIRHFVPALGLALFSTLLLTACGGGSSGSNPTPPPNIAYQVVATATPANLLNTSINDSQTVTFHFTATNSQTATQFSLHLMALPAGWSAPTPEFSCPSVNPKGNDCSITLTYLPTATTTGSMTLSLPYSYAANGILQTGTVSYRYSAISNGTCTPFTNVLNNVQLDITQEIPVSCTLPANGSSMQVTFPSPWPAGWSLNTGATPASLSCSSSSSTCAFVLQYTPTTATTSQSLDMSYAYGTASKQPLAITYSAGQAVQYIYADFATGLQLCTGDPAVSLSCQPSLATLPLPANDENGLVVQNVGTQTYVYAVYTSGETSGSIYACPQSSNGLLGTCKTAAQAGGQNLPMALAFQTVGNQLFAYIALDNENDAPPSRVLQCPVQSDGTFGTCQSLSVPDIFVDPENIDFQSIGTHTYAYISTFGYFTQASDNLWQCTLNADGSFSNCQTAYAPGTTPIPYIHQGVSLNSVKTEVNGAETQETLMYLPSGSGGSQTPKSVIQCVLNNQTGLVSNCTAVDNFPNSITGISDMKIGSFGTNATNSRELLLNAQVYPSSIGEVGLLGCSLDTTGQVSACSGFQYPLTSNPQPYSIAVE